MSNRIDNPNLTVVTIITIACVGLFFVFQESAFSQSMRKPHDRCGDGLCGDLEKRNPGVCPGDCGGKVDGPSRDRRPPPPALKEGAARPTGPAGALAMSSPFGFHPGNADNYAYIRDLGAVWSREGQYLTWSWTDPERDGSYKFTATMAPPKPGAPGTGGIINYDTQWLNVPENINIVANVCPLRMGGDFKNSKEPDLYQNFIRKMVERYDGDNDYGCALAAPDCYKKGDGQYPEPEVIRAFGKNPIKYWQVCNQVFDTCDEDCRKDYASAYALVQEKTYKGVKAADSRAYVLIAGDSARDLYPEVFKKLNGRYIDIVDFHRFGGYDRYDPKKDFDFLKASLRASGYNTGKLRFWITETGTYSGDPAEVRHRDALYQSEKQQAQGLVKAYVSALSCGIEKIFWAWSIVEGFHRDCGIFDYTGLVYDGCDCVSGSYTCGPGVGYDKGRNVKKLSYYAYKKMVEVLEGSDWVNIQTVQEKDGVHVYKFVKGGKPIWAAWNDNPEAKQITIPIPASGRARITETSPKYESGKDVTDYNAAFNIETKGAENGKVTITLKDVPVFCTIPGDADD
jgi:hypothetical protein